MRSKGLILLSGATLAALAAAAWSVKSRSAANAAPEELGVLFEGLDVNAVAELSVQGKDGTATLQKSGDAWVLMESGGYPARFEKIKEDDHRAVEPGDHGAQDVQAGELRPARSRGARDRRRRVVASDLARCGWRDAGRVDRGRHEVPAQFAGRLRPARR